MSVIPEPRRLRQEVQDFKATLGYTVDFRVAQVGYSMRPVSRNGNNDQYSPYVYSALLMAALPQ